MLHSLIRFLIVQSLCKPSKISVPLVNGHTAEPEFDTCIVKTIDILIVTKGHSDLKYIERKQIKAVTTQLFWGNILAVWGNILIHKITHILECIKTGEVLQPTSKLLPLFAIDVTCARSFHLFISLFLTLLIMSMTYL